MVSEQCLVKLKIGPFIDEVLCDIMPMDCCHILFGRPWKYNGPAMYDRRLNRYIDWTTGVKVKLM